jgi:hypothetical protein
VRAAAVAGRTQQVINEEDLTAHTTISLSLGRESPNGIDDKADKEKADKALADAEKQQKADKEKADTVDEEKSVRVESNTRKESTVASTPAEKYQLILPRPLDYRPLENDFVVAAKKPVSSRQGGGVNQLETVPSHETLKANPVTADTQISCPHP